MTTEIEIPRDEACECVDLAMELARKIHECNVTAHEMTDGFLLAVETGHDMIAICLAMASIANERASSLKESGTIAIPSAKP